MAHLRPVIFQTYRAASSGAGRGVPPLISLRAKDGKTVKFNAAERLEPRCLPPSNDERTPRRSCSGSAGRIGVRQSYLSAVEHGRNEVGAEVLLAIRREFGKSLEWLLTGEE